MSNNCFYCEKNDALKELMIEICELEASTLYLFKEQTYSGRCLVAFKGHKNELFDLNDEERDLFMKDVARAAKAMKQAFNVNKVNYGAYSDKMPHLHFHLVPKYEDAPGWGGTFEMNPGKVYLSEDEYLELINKVKENL
ncbi:MAG: HIT family protein [Peptostreptococcaceae bacterium]